jgi:hypothetical protein
LRRCEAGTTRAGLGADRDAHATSLRRRLCNRHRRTVADRDGACVRRRGVRGSSNLRTKSSTPRCVWNQSSRRCAGNRFTCPSAGLGRVHGSRRRCSRIFADDGRGWRRSGLGSQMASSSPSNPTASRHPVTTTFGECGVERCRGVPLPPAPIESRSHEERLRGCRFGPAHRLTRPARDGIRPYAAQESESVSKSVWWRLRLIRSLGELGSAPRKFATQTRGGRAPAPPLPWPGSDANTRRDRWPGLGAHELEPNENDDEHDHECGYPKHCSHQRPARSLRSTLIERFNE